MGWPEWDTYPHDCVINYDDFWYFAKDWMINRGGGMSTYNNTPLLDEYTLNLKRLYQYINDWMTCRARTNNGCGSNGWPLVPVPYLDP
jgi:hypothetical protein